MAKNILVINVDIRETRVALIENGIIAELHLERQSAKGTLGNVYLGKVSRVLPGMQAAFIDIGQERAAFLHVEDLIRPDDFEAYLAGKRTTSADDESSHVHAAEPERAAAAAARPPAAPAAERTKAPAGAPAAPEPELPKYSAAPIEAAPSAEDDENTPFASDDGGAEDTSEADVDDADDASDAEDSDADDSDADGADESDSDDEERDAEGESDAEDGTVDEGDDRGAEGASLTESDDDGAGDEGDEDDSPEAAVAAMEASATSEPVGDAPPATPTTAEDEAARRAPRSRSRRGSRGRRRSGSTAERRKAMEAAPPPPPAAPQHERRGPSRGKGGSNKRDGRRSGGDRDRGGRGSSNRSSKADPLRISKTTPIRDVVREGQEVIVQVSKEPIGTKGARVTSHISLPGRYVVYLPTVEHVGISKRIGSDKERGRLREAIDAMKPPSGGLIVRTLAEGLTKKSLKADVGYLVRLWGEIARKREQAPRAPECLYAELDLVLKVARDLLNDDIEEVVIDNREEYIRLRRFVEMFMPERVDSLKLYEGGEPIFDAYGIEEEIGRALSRKVPLNSGGHLVIDQAEALTAIDVNTGRYVGKGSKDLEDTILTTNLEAVEEIAYQLRFRNIGGLIILDLIDMDRAANREKVRRRLEQLLAKDKAKTTLNRISELGLIEMTRKRTRESLGRLMNEPCFYCDGTGNLQSKQTVAYEILRQIKRERTTLRGYSVTVNAHPAIVDLMKNEERTAVQEAERRYQRRIDLVPRKEYHLEQFDLVGK
ncbi:MAG: Rne/Rng family ribonuclease [Polyangiaceae bacterium]